MTREKLKRRLSYMLTDYKAGYYESDKHAVEHIMSVIERAGGGGGREE